MNNIKSCCFFRTLARIYHKLSTSEPQCRVLTALRSVWVLNVQQVAGAPKPLRAFHHAPLRPLATKLVSNPG